MTKTESVGVYNIVAAAFPDAVVDVLVTISGTESVETTGIRSSKTVARALVRGGLADNVDVGVFVLKSAFGDISIDTLRGKVCRITHDGDEVVQRILMTREHALGGVVLLSLGEYGRVVQ
jgi:hypothetical protein